MHKIIFYFFCLCSYSLLAQPTFDHHYDIVGTAGTDRGTKITVDDDEMFFQSVSALGQLTYFRLFNLDFSGNTIWSLDLVEDGSYGLNVWNNIYPLDDGSYATLYYRTYPEANWAIYWLNFDQNGIIDDFIVSDTSYTELVLSWQPVPDGFLAWIDRSGAPMVVRKYSQQGETLAEWVHSEVDYYYQAGGNIVPLPDGGYLYLNDYAVPGQRETIWGRRDAQGQLLWQHQNELASYTGDSGENIIFTTDSLVVVSERMDRSHPLTDHNGDYVLHCQNLDGDFLWDYSFNYRGAHGITRIIPAANGDIIGAGYWFVEDWLGEEDNASRAAWLFRMSPQGELLWNRYYVPANHPDQEYRFYDVVELPDGRIAASGHYFDTFPNGLLDADAWLVVTDAEGCLYPEDCTRDVVVSTEDFALLPTPAKKQPYFQVRTNPVASSTPWVIDWRIATLPQQAYFQLFDLNGQLHGTWPAEQTLSPTNLAAGLYQLVLSVEGQVVQTQRVLVQ